MAKPVTISRWKLVLAATLGFLGAISAGYQIIQGNQDFLTIVWFVVFLFFILSSVWSIRVGNTE
ncbi:hypothetical protein ACFQE1_02430 [Halobium palmae]|uniref:Uncharacterized protein n=1 Tax=Halobium palmae TaxID=1776492 RepID=A0ABD5RVU1_9EURY